MNTVKEKALRFSRDLAEHHAPYLRSSDERTRDAAIVKMVALVALAYGLPPIEGEPFDIDETIGKLAAAEGVLQAARVQ